MFRAYEKKVKPIPICARGKGKTDASSGDMLGWSGTAALGTNAVSNEARGSEAV